MEMKRIQNVPQLKAGGNLELVVVQEKVAKRMKTQLLSTVRRLVLQQLERKVRNRWTRSWRMITTRNFHHLKLLQKSMTKNEKHLQSRQLRLSQREKRIMILIRKMPSLLMMMKVKRRKNPKDQFQNQPIKEVQ
jgi:hypothetical protein